MPGGRRSFVGPRAQNPYHGRVHRLASRVLFASLITAVVSPGQRPPRELPDVLYVDAERGRDDQRGSERRPLQTLSAAIAMIPDPVRESATIEVVGEHATTGEVDGMPANTLTLMRRMRPGVVVTILGRRDRADSVPVLAWRGGASMIDIREGTWRIENFEVGTFRADQRQGIAVSGPAFVTLKDLILRTRSHSGAGLLAHRGGRIELLGAIRLNEHLHDEAEDESFCGIVATDHGVIKFAQRQGASLDIGNGSLSSSYYGCIRLGCETARITSWGRQSNCFAVNNGGRIDAHGTSVTLCAKRAENTPIGPEHDGHILAEDAKVTIVGKNDAAITLQKASTFTCNDIVLDGEFRKAIWAMSGSMFVGRFLTDVGRIEAHTGASVHVEACSGKIGDVTVDSGAVVSLPDGRVLREDG